MNRWPPVARRATTGRRPQAPRALAAVALLSALSAGCAPGDGVAASADGEAAGTLTVFAAASLRGVFDRLGAEFESAHPGVAVAFAFAGSSDLAAQVLAGAPADVLATADAATMARVRSAGLLAGEPADFAANTLTIVVPPGNPDEVSGFADLARPGLALVVCAPHVPCGAATAALEGVTGVDLTPVSEEPAVADVLTKVVAGEADAGLVYVTDALAAGSAVTEVPFAESRLAVNVYPIAVLDGAREAAADAFVSLVTGERGGAALAAAGFAPPP